MHKRGWLLAAALAVAGTVRADVVHLHSGATLEGDLKKTAEGWMLTLENGAEMQLPAEQVKRVELKRRDTGQPESEAIARSRLTSLNRSVEALTDAQAAVDRYEAFIEQFAATPAADAARRELARWKQRVAEGQVKQGDQWVSPQRAIELQNQATAQAAEARALIKAGKSAEAVSVVDAALKLDPANISALYLKGVLAHRADDLTGARRAWEGVAQRSAAHGPTLNNLAVVAWRQNRLIDALGYYEQAMDAQAQDLVILTNVGEALNAVPRDLREGTVAQRVYRRYVEQDQALQKTMAEQGLYRWGNRYITREEKAQLDARQQEIQGQLDSLAGRFSELETRIRDIDLEGERNDRTLRQIEASTWHRDWEGRVIRLPLPPIYFDIQRDNERLKQQRVEVVAELDRLRKTARDLQQQLPRGRFSGVQQIIGVEGTPAAIAHSPAAASTPAGPDGAALAIDPADSNQPGAVGADVLVPDAVAPGVNGADANLPGAGPAEALPNGAERLDITVGPATRPTTQPVGGE